MDASGWAIAEEEQYRRVEASPARQREVERDLEAKERVKAMKGVYRKVKPCVEAILGLFVESSSLWSSAMNLGPRLIQGSSSGSLGVLAYFGGITEKLSYKHVEQMEKIIATLKSNKGKIELLMEEVARCVDDGFSVVSQARTALTLDQLCLASATSPSLNQMAQWLELLLRMIENDFEFECLRLRQIEKYDLNSALSHREPVVVRRKKWLRDTMNESLGKLPMYINQNLLV